MADIKAFITMIIKNGGAQFVLVLVLAWVFSQYFPINQNLVATLLEWLIVAALIEGIYRLVVTDAFYLLYKYDKWKADRASGNYEEISKEAAGAETNVKTIGTELGIDAILYLKDALKTDPTEKAKTIMSKLETLEAELKELMGDSEEE